MEEKVLLAREEGTRIHVAEDLSEDSDSGCLLEKNPAEERLSESSEDSRTLPMSTGERVVKTPTTTSIQPQLMLGLIRL